MRIMLTLQYLTYVVRTRTFRNIAAKREEEMKRRISWSHLDEQRTQKVGKQKSALATTARGCSPTLPPRKSKSSHSDSADGISTASPSTIPRRHEAHVSPRSEGSSDSVALSDDDERRHGGSEHLSDGGERRTHKHRRDKNRTSRRERHRTRKDGAPTSHRSSSATSDE